MTNSFIFGLCANDCSLPSELRVQQLSGLGNLLRRSDSLEAILRLMAQDISATTEPKVFRRTIRKMRQVLPRLLDGQGPKNFWEEYCFVIQTDSWFCDAIEANVRDTLRYQIEDLSSLEKTALWIQTYAGEGYLSTPHDNICSVKNIPVSTLDIAEHLIPDLRDEAMNYENSNIRSLTGR